VDVAAQQLLEAGLVDRDLASIQTGDLVRIDVQADDVVAALRETGAATRPT